MRSVLQGMLGKTHYANVYALHALFSLCFSGFKEKKRGVIFVNKDI